VKVVLGMHPYTPAYLKVLAAGVIPYGLLSLAKAHLGALPYLWSILAYSLAYGALYLAALFALGFGKEEKVILAKLKEKVLGRP
jgi:thiamine transporter ThiT